MTSFYEIGGVILDGSSLENDFKFGVGQRSASEHRRRNQEIKNTKSALKNVGKTVEVVTNQPKDDQAFGFEEAGTLVGLWVGALFMIATLPVTVVDGPLPIADAAWLYAGTKFTLKAVKAGKEVGRLVDTHVAGRYDD